MSDWQKLGDFTTRIIDRLDPIPFSIVLDGPLGAAVKREAKRSGNKAETITLLGGIGQPRTPSGDTFNGVPGAAASRQWVTFSPTGNLENAVGSVYYCPVLIPEPITLRRIEVATEGKSTVSANVRVAVSAANLDWQPTGPILYQGVLSIPGTAKVFDTFGLSMVTKLQPGLHLFAIETSEPTLQLIGRPATFPGSLFCQHNPEPGKPNHLLDGLLATHTYGPFVGVLPKWDRTSIFQISLYGGWVSPFVVKWSTP